MQLIGNAQTQELLTSYKKPHSATPLVQQEEEFDFATKEKDNVDQGRYKGQFVSQGVEWRQLPVLGGELYEPHQPLRETTEPLQFQDSCKRAIKQPANFHTLHGYGHGLQHRKAGTPPMQLKAHNKGPTALQGYSLDLISDPYQVAEPCPLNTL